ncbi:MAG: ATP synthase F1 subunit gamma [Anaerolineales bacterium]|nr:ATP synthase F1 subunit gamma [Anaerolineales bacterium]
MPSAREIQSRIKTVKNIAQVTRALQAVSASRVRQAMEAVFATRPYANKAWEVLTHIANQSSGGGGHPLLRPRKEVKNILVIMLSGDRGLAGPYNTNIMRFTMNKFQNYSAAVKFIAVGKKGSELLFRMGKPILAEFSNIPPSPTFTDISPIGHMAVSEFVSRRADEVYLMYTVFENMVKQVPTMKKLLPLSYKSTDNLVRPDLVENDGIGAPYTYESGQVDILDVILPRFTALQIYQAVLESQASEHAARMVAMKNATENASDLSSDLQLTANKIRQQLITNEMLDIVGGAEALD